MIQQFIDIPLNTEVIDISVEEGGSGGVLPYYKGDYEVTPKTESIVLSTKNKSMSDNVVVLPIPYREEENAGGGITAIIAGV